jgi:hypothetical protein
MKVGFKFISLWITFPLYSKLLAVTVNDIAVLRQSEMKELSPRFSLRVVNRVSEYLGPEFSCNQSDCVLDLGLIAINWRSVQNIEFNPLKTKRICFI